MKDEMTTNIAYSELLNQPQWTAKRTEILLRDGYKCRNCRATSGLQVHHRQYHIIENTGEFVRPWDYQNQYLITLCETCHKAGHKNYSVPLFKLKKPLI